MNFSIFIQKNPDFSDFFVINDNGTITDRLQGTDHRHTAAACT